MEVDQSLDLRKDTLFDRAVLYTATALFTLTIVLTTVQVFVRWFNIPTFGVLHWTQPAAKFLFIIATYFGAAVAIRNGEHISIRFMLERIKNWNTNVGRLLSIFSDLIVIGFLGVALRATVVMATDAWSTSIGGIGFVTSGYIYFGISIGISLTILYAAVDLGVTMKRIATGFGTDGPETEIGEGTIDE
ncbi:TRAP transporter small permease [Haladaptatus caseinilyticus]|uniref:TRAP transporter small permease n=1 Tax=Haladaptatus caseinilyticus TaxID=2993314 RepID=UPI00224B7652|nr:TRAP transporter small permease subunit [Haladaptatus caseinilyticus]